MPFMCFFLLNGCASSYIHYDPFACNLLTSLVRGLHSLFSVKAANI